MLYSEIIAVCSQIHTKHINTLCGQNLTPQQTDGSDTVTLNSWFPAAVTVLGQYLLPVLRPGALSDGTAGLWFVKSLSLCQLYLLLHATALTCISLRCFGQSVGQSVGQ